MEKSQTLTRINLDSETADKYPSETALKTTLERFAAYSNEQKPLIITDNQRRDLEILMARNFNSADDLVLYLHRVYDVNVDGLSIDLGPRLLERLKSRAINTDFHKFLQFIIKRSLEEYAGLR